MCNDIKVKSHVVLSRKGGEKTVFCAIWEKMMATAFIHDGKPHEASVYGSQTPPTVAKLALEETSLKDA